jgi:DNA repair protein RadC
LAVWLAWARRPLPSYARKKDSAKPRPASGEFALWRDEYLDQEHLRVILLNTRNEVLGTHAIYVGNVNSSVVRPAEVFRPAVRANAPSLIVVHNHPSGNPAPSDDDIAITKDLVESGKMLGIEVLDHLIIGSGQRYVSMNKNGQGFS